MPPTLKPPAAVSGTSPKRFVEGISPSTPFSQAVESCYRQRWAGVLHYLARVAARDEPLGDQIHKLRVSGRRLQALLEALPDAFPAAPRKRVLKLSKRIRRAGEKARELEVHRAFLEQLLPTVSLEEGAAVEMLCDRMMRRRKKAHKKLVRKAPRLANRLKKAGQVLLAEMKQTEPHPTDCPTFVEAGSLAISRQLDTLWDQAGHDHESPESLHQLRLTGKRLRYSMELFLPVLDRAFRDDFLPQLEHIQDLLGDFHDAVVGKDWVRRQFKKWKDRFHSRVRKQDGVEAISWDGFRTGLDAILLAYEQQAEHARTEFQDVWPGFAGESFRIPIEQLLAEIFAESEAAASCLINEVSPAIGLASTEPGDLLSFTTDSTIAAEARSPSSRAPDAGDEAP